MLFAGHDRFLTYYGTEFGSRAMEAWTYQFGVQLDFIRPGKPVENSYIESFNGRLRDECLNGEVFFALADVRDKLECWRQDYNLVRPHSALRDNAPACLPPNGSTPRRLLRHPYRSGGKSPHRAFYWSPSIESVECTNCRPGRPNWITQGDFSTIAWRVFTGHLNNRRTLLMNGGYLGCTPDRQNQNITHGGSYPRPPSAQH